MENNLYFESACKSLLKQQDSKRLLQILIVIRKGLNDKHQCEERIKQLTESGCLRNLTLCLQQESPTILDVTLSLIGNACINYNFCLELLKYGILHTLNRLLERCRKDSIQGRGFRIIGNLCDNTCSHAMMLKEQDLVPKIVRYVLKCSEEDISTDENETAVTEGSVIMAIRALRKLLKQSTLKLLVERYKVLGAVGLLLIKYKKLWTENNQNNKIIVDDILRLLYTYSRFSYPEMLLSLTSTEKGNSLYCLVDFFDFQAFRIVKMIMNWTKSMSLKTELPIKEITEKLFKKIDERPDLQGKRKYLYFLNTLMKVPAYRHYVNSPEYCGLLVRILEEMDKPDNSSIQCAILILTIFRECSNDNIALRNQVTAGVVKALINKLEWSGVSFREIVIPTHGRKRKAKPSNDGRIRRMKIDWSYADKIFSFDATMVGCAGNRCSSPSELSDISSDGPNSPTCSTIQEDICDSDNYSPVCSDIDDVEVQSLQSLEPAGGGGSSSEEEIVPVSKTLTELIQIINVLICIYLKSNPVPADLGSAKLLTMLVNLWIDSKQVSPRPAQTLSSLLQHQEFFIPLIQTDFIYQVHRMFSPNMCVTNNLRVIGDNVMSLLRTLAEMEVVKGDIAHILMRSTGDIRRKVATYVPYLIRTKSFLSKLMINCGGLKQLVTAINKTDISREIVRSLHLLALTHLQRKSPVCEPTSLRIQTLKPNDYTFNASNDNLVAFKFEDSNESVTVDREFLSMQSDYFNGLLCGSFRESIQREVNVIGIRSVAFKSLLLLMNYDRSKSYVKLDLDVMLDLLEMTDRYLLPDLHVYLMECVEYTYMTKESMPVIYQWAIESQTNILRLECVVYTLIGEMNDSERLKIFKNLIDLNFGESLTDDITKLLDRSMKR